MKYGLKDKPLDSFKTFHVDTADHPSSTLRCVVDFFGVDRLVLGTNYPYGPEEGCLFIRKSLKSIEELGLREEEQEKLLGGNAARVLGVSGSSSAPLAAS